MTFHIRPATEADREEWLRLRHALWPTEPIHELEPDLTEYLRRCDTHLAVVAARGEGGLAGFAEIRLRSFADECYTSPVAYLEGWYVDPDCRRQGLGGRLVAAAEPWAKARGCREFGSDTHVENLVSRAAHRALGFEEGQAVVHFRRAI
jgi:aminoglycoside 6'-N-acetyltransferase I